MTQELLIVGIGGFLGANARFLLATLISERWPTVFPLATWLINITGSLAIGFFLVFVAQRVEAVDPRWRLLFVTGFLGAYTTFSTFSWEMLRLIEQQQFGLFALYAISSVVVGLIAVSLGAWLGYRL